MQLLGFSFFAFLGLSSAASSVATNLTSDGCIDAAGFQSCQNAVTASTAACLAHADADGSQLETLACGCTDYIENYNCYSSHCWNRVNECEYQTYIVEYLVGCPTAKLPVPYFPTPANAADACSCNLGEVYLAISGYIQQGAACSTNASTTSVTDAADSVQQIQGCECCEVSGSMSSIYGICPTTDPSLIGLSSVNQLETTLDTPLSSCSSYLTEFPCESELSFSAVAGGTFYSADNLPASGTQTLSNVAGTVTSPASGVVFTYTNGGDSQVYTISAANFNGGGSGGTATTTGKSGGTATGKSGNSGSSAAGSTGSSTVTGSTASAAASKSWGQKNECGAGLLISGVVIGLMTGYF